MESSNKLERLERLDHRFVDIYEETRAKLVEQQKETALIVIDDDVLLLYRRNHPIQRFPGLKPPTYTKMKTLGHIPLAAFCLLCEHTVGALRRACWPRLRSFAGRSNHLLKTLIRARNYAFCRVRLWQMTHKNPFGEIKSKAQIDSE